MIDLQQAIPILIKRLQALDQGECIELCSYKRDRCLLLTPLEGGTVLVVERGFEEQRFEVEPGKLKKLLKTLVRREFPRSTKLRLYELGPCDPNAPTLRKVI
ncbi:hypothetical protein [Endothiovibrio diazotrophicus]